MFDRLRIDRGCKYSLFFFGMGMCILCSVFLALSKCHFTFKAQNIVCSVSLVWFGSVWFSFGKFSSCVSYVYVDIFLFFRSSAISVFLSLNSFVHAFRPPLSFSLLSLPFDSVEQILNRARFLVEKFYLSFGYSHLHATPLTITTFVICTHPTTTTTQTTLAAFSSHSVPENRQRHTHTHTKVKQKIQTNHLSLACE